MKMKTTFCLIQDKSKCICLVLSQAKTPVRLHSVHVQHCTNKLLGTSSAVMCTHRVQLNCFPCGNSFSSQAGLEPDEPGRWQLTPRPSAGWKFYLGRSSTGRVRGVRSSTSTLGIIYPNGVANTETRGGKDPKAKCTLHSSLKRVFLLGLA